MNQSNRRSMNAALQTVELPPEAMALIRAGAPQSQASVSTPAPPTEASATPARTPPPVGGDATSAHAHTKGAVRPIRPKPTSAIEAAPEPFTPNASITVRLPGGIPQQLLRISMERKLRRIRPFTQQDIVADALQEWLKRHASVAPNE